MAHAGPNLRPQIDPPQKKTGNQSLVLFSFPQAVSKTFRWIKILSRKPGAELEEKVAHAQWGWFSPICGDSTRFWHFHVVFTRHLFCPVLHGSALRGSPSPLHLSTKQAFVSPIHQFICTALVQLVQVGRLN